MSLIGTPRPESARARDVLSARRTVLAAALAEAGRTDARTRLFALVDAARGDAAGDDAIFERLKTFDGTVPMRSLYQGDLAVELASVAPYLIETEPGSPVLEWLIAEGWGRSWGVFVLAALEFADLRRHLRKFNLVRTEDGRDLIFRFYDPRALRLFLETSPPDNLAKFFGPIAAFLAEEPDGAALTRYALGGDTLTIRRFRV